LYEKLALKSAISDQKWDEDQGLDQDRAINMIVTGRGVVVGAEAENEARKTEIERINIGINRYINKLKTNVKR